MAFTLEWDSTIPDVNFAAIPPCLTVASIHDPSTMVGILHPNADYPHDPHCHWPPTFQPSVEPHIVHTLHATNTLGSQPQIDPGANINIETCQHRIHAYQPIANREISLIAGQTATILGRGYAYYRADDGTPIQAPVYHCPGAKWPIFSPTTLRHMTHTEFTGWELHKHFETSHSRSETHPTSSSTPNGQSLLTLKSRHGKAYDKHISLISRQDLLFTRAYSILPPTAHNIATSCPVPALFPNNPNNPDDHFAMANSISVQGLAELWHQRLGHSSHEYVRATRNKTHGIPKFKTPDDLHVCNSCAHGATHKPPRNQLTETTPTEPFQDIIADFGFFAPKTDLENNHQLGTTLKQPTTIIEGQHGYKAYLLIIDQQTRYVWAFLTKDKNPPLDIMRSWFREFGNKRTTNNLFRTDNGGELAGHEGFRKLCSNYNYLPQTTAADASYQIGMAERPHRHAGEVVRKLLHNANLHAKYWPYALVHWALLWNVSSHRPIETTPYEAVTGIKPNISRLRVFGCKVYVRRLGDRPNKTEHHVNEGFFLGYTATLDNILYHNTATGRMAKAPSATFDEASFSSTHLTPGGRRLAQATGRDPTNFKTDTAAIDLNLEAVADPYLQKILIRMSSADTQKHGFCFTFENNRSRLYVHSATSNSPAAAIIAKHKRLQHSWLLTVHGQRIRHEADLLETLKTLQANPPTPILWIFAPDRTRIPSRSTIETLPMLNLDQLTRITKNLDRTINPTNLQPRQPHTCHPTIPSP